MTLQKVTKIAKNAKCGNKKSGFYCTSFSMFANLHKTNYNSQISFIL